MDPNFNQMIFRYGSFWFLLKIHPKWLFIEGFRGPRGVDGFGQFFFEPNGYLPVGNDTKHRQATPFARHMFEEPLNSTEDWRFFHVFSLLWGEWSDSHVDDYMISVESFVLKVAASLESCTGCTKWDESCRTLGFFSSTSWKNWSFFQQPQSTLKWCQVEFHLVVCCTGPFQWADVFSC